MNEQQRSWLVPGKNDQDCFIDFGIESKRDTREPMLCVIHDHPTMTLTIHFHC